MGFQKYDLENYKDRKGLKYLYNYDFDGNPEGGVYGEDRAYVTRMCIQTFIGSLEGDGFKCKDQDNAPGKEIDEETGDEVSCSKYIPRKKFSKLSFDVKILFSHFFELGNQRIRIPTKWLVNQHFQKMFCSNSMSSKINH